MTTAPKPTELAQTAGISKSYASEILNGKRLPSRPLAIHIFRRTGWKHDCIASLSAADLDMLERIEPWRSSSSVASA